MVSFPTCMYVLGKLTVYCSELVNVLKGAESRIRFASIRAESFLCFHLSVPRNNHVCAWEDVWDVHRRIIGSTQVMHRLAKSRYNGKMQNLLHEYWSVSRSNQRTSQAPCYNTTINVINLSMQRLRNTHHMLESIVKCCIFSVFISTSIHRCATWVSNDHTSIIYFTTHSEMALFLPWDNNAGASVP